LHVTVLASADNIMH